MTARPHSDFFIDPSGSDTVAAESQLNAVSLTGHPPKVDFTLAARVQVAFVDTFDAGVLIVWVGETRWAKLCFEYSPDRKPMVVSVVTRGVSDDANASIVEGDEVWLRIARIGTVYAFHASIDGRRWEFVRAFALGAEAQEIGIGLEAQSPKGDGCDVQFDAITYAAVTLGDLRAAPDTISARNTLIDRRLMAGSDLRGPTTGTDHGLSIDTGLCDRRARVMTIRRRRGVRRVLASRAPVSLS